MAEAAVAPHVDDDVAIIFLAIFDRQFAAKSHRLGIVAVDVEDRRLDRFGDVRRVRRGTAELRTGGEADLVIDDEMDRSPGAVAGQPRESEAFGDDPLACEGGVAVEQDRQHRVALAIALDGLHRTALAEHDRIDRFKMRRVGGEAEVDLDPVKLAVG